MLDSLRTGHIWHRPPFQQCPALSCHHWGFAISFGWGFSPLKAGFAHRCWVLSLEKGGTTHSILSSPPHEGQGSGCYSDTQGGANREGKRREQRSDLAWNWQKPAKWPEGGGAWEKKGKFNTSSQSPGERQGIPAGKLLNLLWHPLFEAWQLER